MVGVDLLRFIFNHWREKSRFLSVVSSTWRYFVRVSPLEGCSCNLRILKGMLRREFGRPLDFFSIAFAEERVAMEGLRLSRVESLVQ